MTVIVLFYFVIIRETRGDGSEGKKSILCRIENNCNFCKSFFKVFLNKFYLNSSTRNILTN